MGASMVLVKPLRPSNATLAPTPPSELRTPPQVAGRPGEAAWALDPAPAPGHGDAAEGRLFPSGAVESHPGRQVAAPGLGSSGGGQVQVEGLAGRTDGPRVRGHVWFPSGHPRSVWCASAFQGRLRAAWPVRQARSASEDACCGGRGLRRWGLQLYPAGGGDSRERRGRRKEKAEREAKSLEHPVFPRGLPSKF